MSPFSISFYPHHQLPPPPVDPVTMLAIWIGASPRGAGPTRGFIPKTPDWKNLRGHDPDILVLSRRPEVGRQNARFRGQHSWSGPLGPHCFCLFTGIATGDAALVVRGSCLLTRGEIEIRPHADPGNGPVETITGQITTAPTRSAHPADREEVTKHFLASGTGAGHSQTAAADSARSEDEAT